MRWWRGFGVGLLAGVVIGGIFLLGFVLGAQRGLDDAGDRGAFGTLWTVRNLLDRRFIGEAPPVQVQVFGAAHGLVATYNDPYTVFVEPSTREIERDDLRGHFGGIGAYIGRDETGNVVLTTMRDRPAAKAGIQDGDILLEIDGNPVTPNMKIEEIIAQVRGDIGTAVTLKLQRLGEAAPLTIAVMRERIESPSVEWRVLDGEQRLGYMRISIFGERTSDEVRTGLSELTAQGVTDLILDLRGNGGGLVDAAVEITSQFLRQGQVLREIRRGDQERFYPVKPSPSPAHDWKIALLVDGGTASASEIVAGALRDQGRAILIGERTLGKGSVQEVHELQDGSSLHVTVARWLTPNRQEIDGSGLAPDLQVGITTEDRENGFDPQLSRAEDWFANGH